MYDIWMAIAYVIAHTCNLRTLETEAGSSRLFWATQ